MAAPRVTLAPSPGPRQAGEAADIAKTTAAILTTYPALRWLRTSQRPLRHVLRLNAIVAVISGAAMAIGASIDGTLTLPGGAVGLLQHPAPLCFIAIHLLAPWLVARAFGAVESVVPPTSDESEHHDVQRARALLGVHLLRRSSVSRAALRALELGGLVCFIWNSYQNQRPLELVGFDFWDSALHPVGYWITRAYKLYFWVALMPMVVHVQLVAIIGLRRIILSLAATRSPRLQAFHSDHALGVGPAMTAVLRPTMAVVVLASALATAATFIHRRLDLTTVGGVVLASAFLAITYLPPAVALHAAIEAEKGRHLADISRLRLRLLGELSADDTSSARAAEITDVLSKLGAVTTGLAAESSWPELSRIWKVIGLGITSPIGAWLIHRLQVLIGGE